jgi:hypothetical protein
VLQTVVVQGILVAMMMLQVHGTINSNYGHDDQKFFIVETPLRATMLARF